MPPQPCLPPSNAAIADAVQALQPYMIEALGGLVAAASPSGAETPAAVVAEALLGELGLASERVALQAQSLVHMPLYSPACCADGGRYNLLAVHEGSGGPSVLFNGHLDVVPTGPAEMWRHPPYLPVMKDGWLHGRGSGDMKGGIVCALAAFKALRSLGVQPMGLVGFNWVLEEECTGNGTLASIARSRVEAFDAVIIPEPLGEGLITAQVGVFWMRIALSGRPSHAGYMTQGADPIAAGMAVVGELRRLEAEWNDPARRHPAYGSHAHPINFNIGRIEGGEWTSSVPCRCTLDVRIGFYPDMDIADAKAQVAARVHAMAARLAGIELDIRYEGFHAPGCVFVVDSPPMRTLAEAHRQVHGTAPDKIAITATTDARHFRLMLDKPVTCYGPLARDIHGIDEAVSIASMVRVATTFAVFLRDWCGVEPISPS